MSPSLLIIAIAFLILIPANAYSYIDPGTGSFVLQIIIATIAGALLSIKIFWSKITNILKSIFQRKDK